MLGLLTFSLNYFIFWFILYTYFIWFHLIDMQSVHIVLMCSILFVVCLHVSKQTQFGIWQSLLHILMRIMYLQKNGKALEQLKLSQDTIT